MNKHMIKQSCVSLILEACEHEGHKLCAFDVQKSANEMFKDVWPWWKDLSYGSKMDILDKKQSPAQMYMLFRQAHKKAKADYDKKMNKWYRRLWRGITSRAKKKTDEGSGEGRQVDVQRQEEVRHNGV